MTFQKFIKVNDIHIYYSMYEEYERESITFFIELLLPLPRIGKRIMFTKKHFSEITKSIPLKDFIINLTCILIKEIQFKCNEIHKDIIIDNDTKEAIILDIKEFIK